MEESHPSVDSLAHRRSPIVKRSFAAHVEQVQASQVHKPESANDCIRGCRVKLQKLVFMVHARQVLDRRQQWTSSTGQHRPTPNGSRFWQARANANERGATLTSSKTQNPVPALFLWYCETVFTVASNQLVASRYSYLSNNRASAAHRPGCC